MKTLTIGVILVSLCLLNTGCLSVYNHKRVQNDIAERRIIASGDSEAMKMVASGVKPVEAIKFRAMAGTDGQPDGMKIMVSITDLPSYWETLKEAPISSGLSLLGDIGTAYGLYYLYEKNEDNSSSQSDDSDLKIDNVSGDGNTFNIVNGNNNQSNNDDNQQSDASSSVNGDSNYDTTN